MFVEIHNYHKQTWLPEHDHRLIDTLGEWIPESIDSGRYKYFTTISHQNLYMCLKHYMIIVDRDYTRNKTKHQIWILNGSIIRDWAKFDSAINLAFPFTLFQSPVCFVSQSHLPFPVGHREATVPESQYSVAVLEMAILRSEISLLHHLSSPTPSCTPPMSGFCLRNSP